MAFQQPQQRPQPQLLRPTISHDKQQHQTQAQIPASPSGRKRTPDESQEWILFSPAPRDSLSGRSNFTEETTPRTATQGSELGSLQTHVRSQAGGAAGGVEGVGGKSESADSGEGAAGERDSNDAGANNNNDEEDEEDQAEAELDSLDDGLHAFHHPFSASSTHQHNHHNQTHHLDQSGGTVLPRHDGFGTFPSTALGGGAIFQEQLWQFERHNPNRRIRHVQQSHHQRRSSAQKQLDAMEEEARLDVEDERIARIEKWRLDQSRVVLEEIERETRRRKRKADRLGGGDSALLESGVVQDEDGGRPGSAKARKSPGNTNDTGILQGTATAQEATQQSSESSWQRITRKVIRDLIGLDDTTLTVILGETLATPADPSPTPTQTSPLAAAASRGESRVTFGGDSSYNWEVKLLDRIARELGLLVTQLSGSHGSGAQPEGGAFSSHLRSQQQQHEELDYAGLGRLPVRDVSARQPSLRAQRRRELQKQQQQQFQVSSSNHDPMFSPTLVQQVSSPPEAPDTSLWGIEEEPMQDVEDGFTGAPVAAAVVEKEEKEYWEREIDMKMILSYLRDQLFSRVLGNNSFALGSSLKPPSNLTDTSQPANQTTEISGGPLPAAWATTNSTFQAGAQAAAATGVTAEPSHHHLRRAELIRKQHPLISRAARHSHSHSHSHLQHQQQRRQLHHEALLRRQQLGGSATGAAGVGVVTGGGVGGRSSSCASQSTRRSRGVLSRSATGSSRHFWDLGGSVHSGGGGSGGLGGWGEV